MDLDQLVFEPTTPALSAGRIDPKRPYEVLVGDDAIEGDNLDLEDFFDDPDADDD